MPGNGQSSTSPARIAPRPPTSAASEPPFVFEDRTDDDTRAAIMEVWTMRRWVQAQREVGHAPN